MRSHGDLKGKSLVRHLYYEQKKVEPCLTQGVMAARIGLSRAQLSNILSHSEARKTRISARQAVRLGKFFDIPADLFLDEHPNDAAA